MQVCETEEVKLLFSGFLSIQRCGMLATNLAVKKYTWFGTVLALS